MLVKGLMTRESRLGIPVAVIAASANTLPLPATHAIVLMLPTDFANVPHYMSSSHRSQRLQALLGFATDAPKDGEERPTHRWQDRHPSPTANCRSASPRAAVYSFAHVLGAKRQY